MKEPIWINRLVIDAVHLEQLKEHGGLQGLRDENLLESALARARNKWAYEATSEPALLAAAYGYGLATNHPYQDGNKRIAFLAMVIFLGLNGWDLVAPEVEVVSTMLAVAAGQCMETDLAKWLRKHMIAFP
jgi:death-on-curing protein